MKFNGYKNTEELVNTVHETIGYYGNKVVNVEGTIHKYKASLKANIKSKEEADKFIKDYCIRNNESVKVSTTR